jgi:U4/U6.U5 tri-snRNP-associated protein 1
MSMAFTLPVLSLHIRCLFYLAGLAACLGLLKEKGTLKDKMQWAGRTNDKKPVALIGLQDVYTGGSHEDAMSQRIEVALTQRDEFGRVMTPKERFRVMCHQ